MTSRLPISARAPRKSRGFTLVELMIAMILGLIVIAGVTSVFLAGQQSFRSNDALANVQDSSRIAFELLARDIREAGLTGCNSVISSANTVNNVLNDQSTLWWANWANTVHGYQNTTAVLDPALTELTGAGAPVIGASDNSLQLLSAGTDITATNAMYDGSDTQFVLQAPAPAISAGDVVMACTPGHAAIFQVNTYAQSSGTLTFAASGDPGNSSTNLGTDTSRPCGDQGDAAVYCFPENSLLSRLTAVDWYIGTNPEQGTSLYRMALVNVGGVPTPQTQEMVRNVTGMTITYLDPGLSGALGTNFQPASVIDTNGGWPNVTAINVALNVQSNFQRADVTGKKPITRTYAFTTTLRNRVN